MEKLSLYIFFCVLVLTVSCNSITQKGMLHCIIESYSEEFNQRLGDEISLFETVNWSDSTSLISILTIKKSRLNSGKYLYAEYGGLKVYVFKKDDTTVSSKILEGLKWTTIEISNLQDDRIVPPEQFDEVQIIYNPNGNCIEESDMMGRLEFKERIKSQCGFCKV